ncbi:MAG: hypothetical protein R3A52_08945 [Polyangiales bacterium]
MRDAGDVPAFIGPGNLVVTWTVNGMPAADACAMADGANVALQLSFGGQTTLPCTAGRHEAMNLPAGTYNIGADLLRADNSPVYQYNVEANVVSDQTTTVNVDFVPPGRLRVRWTINGNSPNASDGCAAVGGYGVQLRARRQADRTVACGAGTANYTSLQPGDYEVEGVLFNQMVAHPGPHQTGAVPSGAIGELLFEFTAPELMMP